MARIDWVHRRLENWARWHANANSGGLGYATQAAFLMDVAGRSQPEGARIPIDEVEAGVTNDAVESLKLGHGHLFETISYMYLEGRGVKDTARCMGRAESTIHAQLGQADVLLAAWFSDRKRRMEAQAAAFDLQLRAARSPRLDAIVLPAPLKRRAGTLRLKKES